MVLLSIFFTRIRSYGGIVKDCFVHFVTHAFAFHLAVKIVISQIFSRSSDVGLTYICRLYFPPECQQDRNLLRNQYY